MATKITKPNPSLKNSEIDIGFKERTAIGIQHGWKRVFTLEIEPVQELDNFEDWKEVLDTIEKLFEDILDSVLDI